MKAVLTSTGFDNENILEIFLKMINKPTNELKALFVPAALTKEQQRDYAHVFLEDLYKAGITDENIDTYIVNEVMSPDRAKEYDVMYFSGGDPNLLMSKIEQVGFRDYIKAFIDNGGIYFGASAGSDIMTNAVENTLGYLDITLVCHDKTGSDIGKLSCDGNAEVKLTDNQAIIVNGEEIYIAE